MVDETRTVLGLTAEAWCLGAAAVVVIVICLDSIGLFLAHTFAARIAQPQERPSSIPAWRQEANKAKRGVWR